MLEAECQIVGQKESIKSQAPMVNGGRLHIDLAKVLSTSALVTGALAYQNKPFTQLDSLQEATSIVDVEAELNRIVDPHTAKKKLHSIGAVPLPADKKDQECRAKGAYQVELKAQDCQITWEFAYRERGSTVNLDLYSKGNKTHPGSSKKKKGSNKSSSLDASATRDIPQPQKKSQRPTHL
jgi:hypothetical protein